MTDAEQLLLELVNRARANPSAEATRYNVDLNEGLDPGTISTTPKAPLAPHQSLTNSSQAHSQDMLDRDFFDHENPDHLFADDRAVNAGYPTSLVGENIAFAGTSGSLNQVQEVYDRHQALFLSPGHRENMLHEPYVEAGTGIRYGVFTEEGTSYNSIMVTENFGIRTVNPFITGVVYTDTSGDDFYSVGEAIRSGSIRAVNHSTGTVYQDDIGNSGGYRVGVPAGTYSVTATYSMAGTVYVAGATVVVGSNNVKQDFETGSVTYATLSASADREWVNESGTQSTVTIHVTRSGATGAPLTVTVSVGDSTELAAPATVTIPAGQSSVDVLISGVADAVIDADIQTLVTFSAAGFTQASRTITTVNSDVPSLPAGPQTSLLARPTFSWTAVADAARYELWVNRAANGQTLVIHETTLTTNSYTPAVDMNLGTFLVWVRAFNAGGTASRWTPATTWYVRPRPVINQAGSVFVSSTLTLTWTAITGASAYDLWIDRNTTSTSQYYRNAAISGASTDLSGFDLGTYTAWVQPLNEIGERGTWSPAAQLTVSTPPTGLIVNGGLFGDALALSWNAVPGAAKYDVWVNNVTTGASQVFRNTNVSGTTIGLPGLTAGRYRAWVRGRDLNGGNYQWSTPEDFVFGQPPVVIAPVGSGQPSLPVFTWTQAAGAVRYELWVSSLDNPGRVIHQTQLTVNHYTAQTALATGNYRTWVRAFDSSGAATLWSRSLDFTV
ncbi:MAG: hypothetical protein KDA96_07720 [Planctomycetaceae bacterium]|nr:hypothetical protein [Planctomycetaceae bacterium]